MVTIISFTSLFLHTSSIADACSIIQTTPAEDYERADVVFVGKVFLVATSSQGETRTHTANVGVDTFWKGYVSSHESIISSGIYTCGPAFGAEAEGKTYLIYATKNTDGRYMVQLGQMKLAEYFEKEISALGEGETAIINMPTVSPRYVFNTNLMVGSSGADVANLQTVLLQKGYSLPSISSGAATKGYFGAQTKSAVMKYQTSLGLPSTGYVGPLTRGHLNK